jgi:hypothetical protein
MNTFEIDGITFDLAYAYVDVTGIEWQWTGEATPDGQPLMRSHSEHSCCRTPVSLLTVYLDHGPLHRIDPRPTRADFRAAVDPDFAATAAAGYVEGLEDFAARITPAVAAAPAPAVVQPAPAEVRRGFFARLARGGA